MKRQKIRLILFFVLLSSSAGAEELKLSISTSGQANVTTRFADAFEKETKIKIVNVHKGVPDSVNYFKDVLEDRAEGAISCVIYNDWLELMRKAGTPEEKLQDITYRTVGKDEFTVIAHAGVGVTKLTADQVIAVFTGQATSWKDVGGADVPVTWVTGSHYKNNTQSFKRNVLKNKEYTSKMIMAPKPSYEEVTKVVTNTPGAMAFGPSSMPVGNGIKIEFPTIGRPCVLITKGKPSPRIEAFIDFIRKNGGDSSLK